MPDARLDRARQGYEGYVQATPTHSHMWMDCTTVTREPQYGTPVRCQVCGAAAILPFKQYRTDELGDLVESGYVPGS